MQLRKQELDFEKYKQLGVDITLLIANLKRTPTERVLHHQEMLAFVEEARKNLKSNVKVRKTDSNS